MPGNPQGGEQGGQEQAGDGPPLVTEELQWRARALEAEEKLRDAEARLSAFETELQEARMALEASELERELNALLSSAGAIDLDTARLVARELMSRMDEPSASAAVDEACACKPFLFHRSRAGASALAGEVGADASSALAERARESGDRRALMRYLRARRGV